MTMVDPRTYVAPMTVDSFPTVDEARWTSFVRRHRDADSWSVMTRADRAPPLHVVQSPRSKTTPVDQRFDPTHALRHR